MSAESMGLMAELATVVFALWKMKILLPFLAVLSVVAAVGKK